MKKSLISLAVLAVVASSAFAADAAPNVEVFGVVDAAITNVTAGGAGSQTLIHSGGNTSSRLGFKGTEKLGDSLSANFWLEAEVTPDTGNGGATSTNNVDTVSGGLNFGRRATVGLAGAFGEIRLGRDYTPSFTNLGVAWHPFGVNGLGNSGQLFYPVAAGGTTARTNVRASNSVGYHSPVVGGYSLQLMYATGEQASTAAASENGDYLGGRVAYTYGPLNVSLASGTTKYATGDYTQSNFGLNYKVGPAKLMYLFGENKVGGTKTTSNMVGTQYTIGSGEVRFAYTNLHAEGVAADANQFALGYVHNLSKRTALYTNYSVVDNDGAGTNFTVGDGLKTTEPGGVTSGFQVGVRHSF